MAYLLRVDAWIGTVRDTATAHAPEILAEPVKEAAACFVISHEFPRAVVGGPLSSGRLLVSYVGVVPKASGRKSATGGRTFRATDLTSVEPALPLLELTEQLPPAAAAKLVRGADERGAILSREATTAIIGALRRLRPALSQALDRLEALNAGQRVITGAVAERYAEDRDKLGVAMRIFDGAISQPWNRPSSDDDPYTVGLATVRDAPLEADAIAHDSNVIRGFRRMFESMPGMRQDLKIFYSRDRSRMTGAPRVMQTLNVNASGGEALTGGDLLYYHVQSKSCVVVQYKRLEGRGARFRIDDRLPGQIERMAVINEMGTELEYLDDWRLGPDSCYLKLIEPQGHVDPDDTGMIAGRYLPLSYAQAMVEMSGGRVVDTDQIRHLTNTLFIDLVKEGWIGTAGVEIQDLMQYCKDQAAARRTLLLAVEQSDEKTVRARMTRSRRRGQ